MKNRRQEKRSLHIFCCLLTISCFLLFSCGYRLVGSRFLPFNSITIKPVKNNTYEPKLEERMHLALSNEFINQGIEVKASSGEAAMETSIMSFALGAIGAVDENIMEQEILMAVDLRLINKGKISEFEAVSSPIKITYQSTGAVSQSVAFKESAADKACREIAKEIVSKIIIDYVK